MPSRSLNAKRPSDRTYDGDQAIGVEVSHSRYLALLAEGLNKAGRNEEGLRVLEEALALAQRNGEQYYQAELNQAIKIAQRQNRGRIY